MDKAVKYEIGLNQAHSACSVRTGPAQPIVFDGLAGFFHAASGDTAVLLLSPWGYEELCSRKTYRVLGETLAAQGYPCLRFDYPGTGHSSGDASSLVNSSAWRNAVRQALEELRALTGARKMLVLGQGVGGALAADLTTTEECDGLILLAPVAQGRAYLRELAAWTAMTQPIFLVSTKDGPEGGLMAGGFVLSKDTATEIKSLNLFKQGRFNVSNVLLVERLDHPGDEKLAEHFKDTQTPCDRLAFEGYVDYVSDPTLSVMPSETVQGIADWVAETFPVKERETASQVKQPTRISPVPGIDETLVRFGPDNMFFGVYSRPTERPAKAAVVFLNSGYDHSIGWAGMAKDAGRMLAQNGYAALRMDLSGVGESRYWPDQPAQVLYSKIQVKDVSAAIDWLGETAGIENFVLFGRCSGAYMALQVAAQDQRVDGIVMLNARRFIWDPDEDVDKAIREPLQSLETYRQKSFDKEILTKVVRGEINPLSAGRKVLRALGKRADIKFAPVLGQLSKHRRLSKELNAQLRDLEKRDVPIQIVYSVNDVGLSEVKRWFGEKLEGLSAFSNLHYVEIPDADHNLSPPEARKAVETLLRDFVSRWG